MLLSDMNIKNLRICFVVFLVLAVKAWGADIQRLESVKLQCVLPAGFKVDDTTEWTGSKSGLMATGKSGGMDATIGVSAIVLTDEMMLAVFTSRERQDAETTTSMVRVGTWKIYTEHIKPESKPAFWSHSAYGTEGEVGIMVGFTRIGPAMSKSGLEDLKAYLATFKPLSAASTAPKAKPAE